MPAKQKNLPFFLSFIGGELQVLSGAWERNSFKVQAYAAAKIPLDFFSQGEIVQPVKAAQIINQLRQNSQPQKIKNHFCYFTLPDEVIFTKYLVLPQVKKEELEKTIKFQIKDFLPHRPEEMYIDWQAMIDGSKMIEIGVVAIKKSIIDSFLKTCVQTDIMPLGFQPESYSLTNLVARFSSELNLLIYFNTHKIIFCFNQKGVVLLNTSLNLNPSVDLNQSLIKQLNRSVSFWQQSFAQQKQIKQVFLAGMVQDELVVKQAVKNSLGLETQKLNLALNVPPNFSPLNMAKLTPLLGLAFSHQQAELEQKQIFLIPKKLEKERESFKFKNSLKDILKISSLVLWGFVSMYVFIFLSFFFQLHNNNSALSGWQKSVITTNQLRLEQKAVNLNQTITTLGNVLGREQVVSALLADFYQKIPAGIIVADFNFNPLQKTIEIRGTASFRADVLALEKALAQFGQVKVPLSSLEELQNPKFRATVVLK